jgi:hypothetical protein
LRMQQWFLCYIKRRKFLVTRWPVSFPRLTLLHVVSYFVHSLWAALNFVL